MLRPSSFTGLILYGTSDATRLIQRRTVKRLAYVVFAIVLAGYALILLVVSYLARRKIHNVEDFVLAGRQLGTGLASVTMIATWYGAESLMTTADEVAVGGIRRAMLDPFGISLCLVFAALFVSGPLWRMGLTTVPDFFRVRYGKLAETFSALLLVPSYFGWIGAQYLALGTLLNLFFAVPVPVAVVGVALLATTYSILGGMWSVTWTDLVQMFFILAGLVVVGVEIFDQLGDGDWMLGWQRIRMDVDPSMWQIASPDRFVPDVMVAVSALAIGSLGNLPVQDLMQRICSTKSSSVAKRACWIAAVGYLSMGFLPIFAGLASSLMLTPSPSQRESSEGILIELAQQVLSTPLLLLFVLAVVSTVLSTVVSAVLAPASVLAQNLVEPLLQRRGWLKNDASRLRSQRLCVIAVSVASLAMALSGSDAYELVEASYSLSLVALFAGFVVGLHWKSAPPAAALGSMLSGTAMWLLHVIAGSEYFLEPILSQSADGWAIRIFSVFPHELGDTLISICTFFILSIFVRSRTSDSH